MRGGGGGGLRYVTLFLGEKLPLQITLSVCVFKVRWLGINCSVEHLF